jgi:hypothetical protein
MSGPKVEQDTSTETPGPKTSGDGSKPKDTLVNIVPSFSNNKTEFLKSYTNRLDISKKIHIGSAQYYDRLNSWISTPSILITSLSGIMSFLATSTVVPDSYTAGFGITVGVLSATSTLLQTLSSSYKYSTKAEMHRTAADQYEQLIVKMRFELANPDDPKFIEDLEAKILEIQKNCKYFPPQSICDKHNP